MTLEGDNAALTAEVAELQADLAALQAAFDAEAAKLEAATAELAEVTAALASANADNDQLETRLANAQAEIAAAQAECDSLREQLAAARARVVTVVRTVTVGGDASVWSPAFGTQIVSFTQSSTVEGHVVSREVEVTAGDAVITSGGEATVVITYDGLASLELAQAAITAVGSHTIVKLTTTTTPAGQSAITYTAGFDLGSHTITTSTGTPTVETSTEDIPYSVAAAPVADTDAPVINVLTRTADFRASRPDGFVNPLIVRASSNEGTLMVSKLGATAVEFAEFQIVGSDVVVGDNLYVFTAVDAAGNSSELTFTLEITPVAPAGQATDTTSGGGSTTPEVDPADVPGAWSYSYVGGSDANWAAGEIDLAGNTLIEFIAGVRTRVWTINGERDASTPSDLNASNQEVENKQIRNTSYVTPITAAWTDGTPASAADVAATGSATSTAYTHNVYSQSFTITETEDFLGNFFTITFIGSGVAADATEYASLAEAVAAAKAAIVAAQ